MEESDSTINDIANTKDRVVRVWLVSLGIAAIWGTMGNTVWDNSTELELIDGRLADQEIKQRLAEAEQKKTQEFSNLIQEQNDKDHEEILEAIMEVQRELR